MFCRHCGYEYQENNIRFCPKCGKNVMSSENNIPGSKEINMVYKKFDNINTSKEELFVTIAKTE